MGAKVPTPAPPLWTKPPPNPAPPPKRFYRVTDETHYFIAGEHVEPGDAVVLKDGKIWKKEVTK